MEKETEKDKVSVNYITKTYSDLEETFAAADAVIIMLAVASFAGFGAMLFFEMFVAPATLTGAEYLFALSTFVSLFSIFFGGLMWDSLRLWYPDLFNDKRAILSYEVDKS